MSVRGILNTLPYLMKFDAEEDIYKSYIARCVRVVTENTARMARGGSYITKEYDDIVRPKTVSAEKAEEIIEDIISRAGIEVKNK